MEIRDATEMLTMSIRTTTAADKLSQEMGKSYGEIMHCLAELGVQPIGAPFSMYHNMDMANLDVEMGFAVAGTHPGKGRVKPGTLPGGRTAVALHTGPYEEIERTYNELQKFVQEQGETPQPFMYEMYLNDPQSVPASELETEIFFPLK